MTARFSTNASRRAATFAGLSFLLAGGFAFGAAAQAPPVTPDDFVAAAGTSNQYELMAANVALTESPNGKVRAFAQQMKQDHAAANASLSKAATASGLKPPAAVIAGDQAHLLGALQSLRGQKFDHAYAHQQTLAHLAALATERGYARTGTDTNLRNAANADVPMIERHLHAAQALEHSMASATP